MEYRKCFLAVNCSNDKEKEEVQKIFNAVSNTLKIKGSDIIKYYPVIINNMPIIQEFMAVVKSDANKAVKIMKIGNILTKLFSK